MPFLFNGSAVADELDKSEEESSSHIGLWIAGTVGVVGVVAIVVFLGRGISKASKASMRPDIKKTLISPSLDKDDISKPKSVS